MTSMISILDKDGNELQRGDKVKWPKWGDTRESDWYGDDESFEIVTIDRFIVVKGKIMIEAKGYSPLKPHKVKKYSS